MKTIKMLAMCVSLLTTVSLAGCVCGPGGYYAGVSHGCYTSNFGCDSGCGDMGCGDMGCETACDPCGAAVDCGVIEYGGNPCMPLRSGKIMDCRSSFSNIGNGICVFGRGVLDVAAAPFIVVGNVLTSGCRYNVSVDCGEVYCGSACEVMDSCSACGSVGSSGCTNCAGGYTEGIEYNTSPAEPQTSVKHRPVLAAPHKHTVMQAVYQDTPASAAKFVQPK